MADLYVQPILGQPSQNKIGQRTLYCPAAPDKIFNPVLIGERNVPALTLNVYNFIKTLPNFASLSQIYLEKIGYYRLLCPELDVAMATAF